MRNKILSLSLAAAALSATADAQSWSDLITRQWPGESIRKVAEKEFESFVQGHVGRLGKAGAHDAFHAAQHAALGLPLPVRPDFLVTGGRDTVAPTRLGADRIVNEAAEPNNTVAAATPIRCGDHAEGDVSVGGDEDWWTFNLASPSEVWISVQPGQSGPGLPGDIGDSVLELWDGSATTLIAANDDFDRNATNLPNRGTYSFLRINLQAGTYVAKLRGFSSSRTGNYSFDLLCTPFALHFPEGPEPNSPLDLPTAGAPTLLPALDTISDGQIQIAGDTDYYRLGLSAPTSLILETGPGGQDTNEINDSTLEVFDANGASIAVDDDGGTGAYSQILVTLPAGTYDIDVRGFGSSTGSYRLYVWPVFPPQNPTVEAAEPNQSTASATPLACGNVALGNVLTSDQDWYAFSLTQAEVVGAYTLGDSSGQAGPIGDTILRLFDSNGVQIGANDDGGRGLFSEFNIYLEPGTYYWSVEGFGAGDVGDYILYTSCPPSAAYATSLPGGCAGSSGNPPQLLVRDFELPVVGTTFVVDLVQAPANTFAFGIVGVSTTQSPAGQALPLDLSPLGMIGCQLEVGAIFTPQLSTNAFGAAAVELPIPLRSALVANTGYVQAFVLDPGANSFNATTSNTLVFTFGDRASWN